MSTGSFSIDDLRVLVDLDPQRALDAARAHLVEDEDRPDAAALWWIAGLAERLLGDTTAARASLERAVGRAGAGGDRRLLARVTISLAHDVGHTGDLIGALAMLDRVEADVDEADHANLALQRGVLHYRLGRLDLAVAALLLALDRAVAIGDLVERAARPREPRRDRVPTR